MDATEAFRARWRNRKQPALISVHRGLWGPAPENSLIAIYAASGFGVIEIDAQMAADGVPVVIHDADLMRTTGVDLVPQQSDHKDLTVHRLLAGAGGTDAKPTDQYVPTLEQALKAAGPKAYFDIDVKYPEEVDAIATALAGMGLAHMGSLKVKTETASEIAQLLALQNRCGAMVMAKVNLAETGLEHIKELTDAGVAAAEVWFDDLDQLAQACAIAGGDMAISTYTLDPVHCCGLSDAKALKDPSQSWGLLLDAGVTVIMTDQAAPLEIYMVSRA